MNVDESEQKINIYLVKNECSSSNMNEKISLFTIGLFQTAEQFNSFSFIECFRQSLT